MGKIAVSVPESGDDCDQVYDEVPSVVATSDRAVQPELQRFVAKRMGATTYEVDSSHVPMLSNPKLVIDVIRTAANA